MRVGPTLRRLRWQLLLRTVAALALVAALTIVGAQQFGAKSDDLTLEQRTIIAKLESVLLHDTVDPQYFRVTVQPNRGVVAGIGDFATADGTAAMVVAAYTARAGGSVISTRYGPTLARLTEQASPDMTGLAGFAEAWQQASRDPVFRRAQDDFMEFAYFVPAEKAAHAAGIRSALGVAIFLDTLLQHGDGDDPDGLPALVARTSATMAESANEADWLTNFLAVREDSLVSPADPGRKAFWPLTVVRVQTLGELVQRGALDLTAPVVVNPYGTVHSIDASPPRVEPPSMMPPVATASPAATASPGRTPTIRPTRTVEPSQPTTSTPAGQPRREGMVVGIAGLCLDLNNASPTPGAHLKTWECNNTEAQRFVADSFGMLIAMGVCAQPVGGVTTPGTQVKFQPCDVDEPSQHWHFVSGQLRNQASGGDASGSCLSVPDDSTEAGAMLVVLPCNGSPGQLWTIVS